MNILITNDDGIKAPGIAQLSLCLADMGHRVTTIAPDRCRSASSMSLTLGKPVQITPSKLEGSEKAFYVTGTSVDCVKLALVGLKLEKPDLLISGINIGLNVARDLHYSATVGAAIEATLSDIPSIAISAECDEKQNCRLNDACDVLSQKFDEVTKRLFSGAPRIFANINVPLLHYKDICNTQASQNLVYGDCYKQNENGYELVGPRDTTLRNHKFDLGAINDSCASISYLQPRWN